MPFDGPVGSASVVVGTVYLIGGPAAGYPHRPFLAAEWAYAPKP